MSNLTCLYYTAGRIHPRFGDAVRCELLRSTNNYYPIICVSHGPLAFGDVRIDVGLIAPSIYQVYVNTLLAAKAADTEYVCCVEDDTVYAPEHFHHRPAPDVFAYDRSRWVLTRRLADDGRSRVAFYYWRLRAQLAMLIARRSLLIETLEERLSAYPSFVPDDVAKKTGWGEPGRYEKNLRLTPRARAYFEAGEPSITVNHTASLMGRRQVQPTDLICEDLTPWGKADRLWRRIHG